MLEALIILSIITTPIGAWWAYRKWATKRREELSHDRIRILAEAEARRSEQA